MGPARVLLALLSVFFFSEAAKLIHEDSSTRIPGQYIVVLKDKEHLEDVISFTNISNTVIHKYEVINGFAAKLDSKSLKTLLASPYVDYIEVDQVVNISACEVETGAPWGIDRVGETELVLDGLYSYSTDGGSGVIVYIVDTGIYVEHSDFGGRASFGYSADSSWSKTDGNGHGTHVASTAAGKTYGIAKAATLVAVKVLSDGGSGSVAGVIAGVNWVTQQYNSNKKPSVANMSLGGSVSTSLDSAVNSAAHAGVSFAVAAGNSDADAVYFSPARAANAITVAASDTANKGGVEEDIRAVFSNYGTKIDVIAPGESIPGAWIGSVNAIRTISGTSMASPHVVGVAALIAQANPTWTFSQVKAKIVSDSLKNYVDLACSASETGCLSTPNRLLHYVAC